MTWQDKVKELYGYRYRSIVAHMAGVSKRTVERWDLGKFNIRQDVVDKINKTYDLWRG